MGLLAAAASGKKTVSRVSRSAVPAPGEWTASLYRRDLAGNESEAEASTPVTLRYDPDPPELGFESPSVSDPTLVAVDVSDKLSGVASGSIELRQGGAGVWQELPSQVTSGSRLVARLDDAALPPGPYVLRARATDQAGNDAWTDRRVDGQPMEVTLPIRTATAVSAGFPVVRTLVQSRRRNGKREWVRQRVTVNRSAVRIMAGSVVQVVGRLTSSAGGGIAGQSVGVSASSAGGPERVVGTVQTDGEGRFAYSAAGTSSETLRFTFAGSATLLPSRIAVTMSVPAVTAFMANRRSLRNGQTVTFAGQLRTRPAPPGGKLLELQVLLPAGWKTFRTVRSDPAGRWTARYHFTRTGGVQHYRFRVRLPEEASYPFAVGVSQPLVITVRGG